MFLNRELPGVFTEQIEVYLQEWPRSIIFITSYCKYRALATWPTGFDVDLEHSAKDVSVKFLHFKVTSFLFWERHYVQSTPKEQGVRLYLHEGGVST